VTGYGKASEEPADHGAEQRARRVAGWQELITGLGSRLDVTGDLHERVAVWASDLAGGNPRSLAIVDDPDGGEPGVGKTWQVLHGVLAAYEAGWTGAACYVMPSTWRAATRPPEDAGTLRSWAACGLLVLDDLGALRLGDWDGEHLYLIADDRWRTARPTVLISNNPDLRAMLGERIASRFAEGAEMIKLGGSDRRRGQA
jgi:hypothetical protein